MPRYDRGGRSFKTGKIGRVNCLRQQLLLPGERLDSTLEGEVKVTALREEASLYMHARLDAFLTPVRWLWPELPAFLAEGPASARVWPTQTLPTSRGAHWSDLGIGGANSGGAAMTIFESAPMRIFNEWYKWPEDGDITGWPADGPKSVNLPHAWTRLQEYAMARDDTELVTQASGSNQKFDVRALSELQARFRQAVEQEYLAHDRYVALLRECWNAQGSREVDKVPIRLTGAELGVRPYDREASDYDGLGGAVSMYDFRVHHNFRNISVPEHTVVTYMLLLRFSSMAEDEVNPTASIQDRGWASLVGEPGILASQRPQAVKLRNISTWSGGSTLGYLPAGWEWRARWNVVGRRVDERNTFPMLRSLVSVASAADLRDATRIGEPFRSASLGDYLVDISFSESVDSPIPGPRSSLFAGVGDAGRGSAYPYPGPRRVV